MAARGREMVEGEACDKLTRVDSQAWIFDKLVTFKDTPGDLWQKERRLGIFRSGRALNATDQSW